MRTMPPVLTRPSSPLLPSLLFDKAKNASTQPKSAPTSSGSGIASRAAASRKRKAPSTTSASRKRKATGGTAAIQRTLKRPPTSSTDTSSRKRHRKSALEQVYYNDTRKIKKKFRENFCLLPKVAQHILQKLALDAAGQRALCGFLPCSRPTGPESFYNPVFRIGTDACHPEAFSFEHIRVMVGKTVGTATLTEVLELGTINDLYLASADAPYYEHTTDAPSNARRAATRLNYVIPELFVNIKLENYFSGHALSGDLSRPHLPAARAQGKFYKLKSQVFMLKKTAKAFLNGCTAEQVASVDKGTFDKVLATYKESLAQAERKRLAQASGDGDSSGEGDGDSDGDSGGDSASSSSSSSGNDSDEEQ
jgi:hypothetical protein